MFAYLGLGLSRSPCQAAGSCRTKSVLPESMAPLRHSQEVQIQGGKLSIATRRQSGQVARRLQQLKFKWVQIIFFLALICSEFVLNSLSMAFPICFLPLPYHLPSAALVPVSFYVVCTLPVVSDIWGVFASQYLCTERHFVGALRFPGAAVEVSQRILLCESGRGTCEPPNSAGKQRREV